MPGARFLQGDRIALRTVEEEDAPFLRDHANDPRIRYPMTFGGPTNLEEQREYIDEDDGDGAQFIVTVSGEETGFNPEYVTENDPPVEPIGFVSLFHVDERAGEAEVAYWLTPPAQENGFATEAVTLLLDYAFETRRLHRVKARALVTNDASRNLLASLGFSEEGTSRDAKFVDGEYVDVDRFAILEGEWA